MMKAVRFATRGINKKKKDGELLGLEWGMIRQVSNRIFADEKFRHEMSIFQRVG